MRLTTKALSGQALILAMAFVVVGLILRYGVPDARAQDEVCGRGYDLPGDVDLPEQSVFDRYSWNTFLALNAPAVGAEVSRTGDNPTQWQHWSSTDDLIQCQQNPDDCVCQDDDCSVSGARYYPPECQAIEGHENYRVVAEPAKVDDSFLEAANGSLSPDPVLDKNGRFLRFEILASPVTYDFVIENQYYDQNVLDQLTEPVNFPCGESSYRGGDPADPRIGAYTLKLAWMELGEPDKAKGEGGIHTEDLLVYDPSYRDSTGEASCRLATMGLVGMHIAHKTINQPKWTWSTFEHRRNVPNCTSLPPAGNMGGGQNDPPSGPSTACPTSVKRDYYLFPASCADDGSDPLACQTCNTAPVSNAPANECDNPDVANDVAWCLDLPPAQDAGMTKACRQVPIKENYPTAHVRNTECKWELGRESVWRNYRLISTQWFDEPSPDPGACVSGSSIPATRTSIRPQVDITGDGQSTRPYLANTTMETYVRANCMGCHNNASVDGMQGSPGTDEMYFLQLEVTAND